MFFVHTIALSVKTGSQKSHLYKLSFKRLNQSRHRGGVFRPPLLEHSTLSSYNILYNRMIQHIQLKLACEQDAAIAETVSRFALLPSLSASQLLSVAENEATVFIKSWTGTLVETSRWFILERELLLRLFVPLQQF